MNNILRKISKPNGILSKTLLYIILIGISFIYLYPIIRMLSMSLMSLEDLNDSQRNWIPSKLYFSNFNVSMQLLNYWTSLKDSLIVSVIPSLVSVATSSLVGYGLAVYDFKGRKIILALLLITFIVPTVLTSLPTFIIYRSIGILDSLNAYIVPALFGFGIRQSLFILIFFSFFRVLPKELFESAEIDGASQFRIFLQIAIPLTLTAFLICFLYSFVWYYNETTLVTLYFPNKYAPLSKTISGLETKIRDLGSKGNATGEAQMLYNKGTLFSGILLSIAPLILVYAICQRWFIEGIDKSGIAGQ